jgi:hypothetical protein
MGLFVGIQFKVLYLLLLLFKNVNMRSYRTDFFSSLPHLGDTLRISLFGNKRD